MVRMRALVRAMRLGELSVRVGTSDGIAKVRFWDVGVGSVGLA